MDNNDLIIKNNRITLLEDEIKLLEEKKKELNKLESEYYKEYFCFKREEYAWLTGIPKNVSNKENVLWSYSCLNIDEIAKMICTLFKDNIGKEYNYERTYYLLQHQNDSKGYYVNNPIMIIGENDNIKDGINNDKNIIIEYSTRLIEDSPTDNPVEWTSRYGVKKNSSNYKYLLNYVDGLSFDYKNYEFIKELIYSLAYYQKEHNIRWMSTEDTRKIFSKIYKK